MNKLIKMLGMASVILTGGGVLAEEVARPVYTLTVTESGKIKMPGRHRRSGQMRSTRSWKRPFRPSMTIS